MLPKLSQYLKIKRTPGAIPELDGLRAIAIGLVILGHTFQVLGWQRSPISIGKWDPMWIFANGWAGVDLFFVLSGFLIAKGLLQREPQNLSFAKLGKFWFKRMLRILPLYYTVLFLVAFKLIPFYPIHEENWAYRLGYHLLLLQDYFPTDFVGTFWSLGVEEKFYFLAPFLIFWLTRSPHPKSQLRRAVLLVCLAPVSRAFGLWELGPQVEWFSNFRSPFHMSTDGLFLGVLAAVLYKSRDKLPTLGSRKVQQGLFWFGAGLSGFLLCGPPLLSQATFSTVLLTPFLLSLGFSCLLLGLILNPEPPCKALWGHRILLVICRLSYSLYLSHMLLALSLKEQLVVLYFGTPLQNQPSALFLFLFLGVFFSLSCLLAMVLHFLIEKPFLLIKDRF